MLPLMYGLQLPHFSLVFFNFHLILNAAFALSRIFRAPTLKFLATCAPVRQLYLTSCSEDLRRRLHKIHTGLARSTVRNLTLTPPVLYTFIKQQIRNLTLTHSTKILNSEFLFENTHPPHETCRFFVHHYKIITRML